VTQSLSSSLLGRPQSEHQFKEFYGGVFARDRADMEMSTTVYFLGIIDTLTTYDFKKRSEHMFKSFIHDSVLLTCFSLCSYIFSSTCRNSFPALMKFL